MRYVAASTVPVDEIVTQPPGTIVYVELEPGAPASRVQSQLADRAWSAGVTLRTRTRVLLDTDDLTAIKVLRVEVVG